MSNICNWIGKANGYWEPGCYRSRNERLMSFANGKGPVESGCVTCPNCGKPIFEQAYREEWEKERDEFIMELNERG